MSRALAAALLAQGVLGAVNIHYIPGLPTPTPTTNVEIPGVNQLANIVAAAATDSPGLSACADAEDIIEYCVDSIPNFTRAENSVIAACMCCTSSSYIAPLYSSCKSYITASAPKYTNDFTLVSIASSLCSAQGRGVCSATGLASGSAGATTSRSAGASASASRSVGASASASGVVTGRPAACTSFASVISSCSSKLSGDDFFDQDGREQASCICYSRSTYTTKFDDYASSCARWARTGLSTGYSDIAELTTFCEDYPASTTRINENSRGSGNTGDDDTTSTTTSNRAGGSNTSPSSTTTVTPAATAPPGNPAPRNAASGLFVLGAVFAGLLLA